MLLATRRASSITFAVSASAPRVPAPAIGGGCSFHTTGLRSELRWLRYPVKLASSELMNGGGVMRTYQKGDE